ncbi:Zn(II)2Cys6 transcription factor, partial [Colletotrichum tofieldiae]
LHSTTIKNTHQNKRNWIWLAPSSTWSFTARLTLMMAENLQLETPFNAPSFLNYEVYTIKWRASNADDQPDISGFPSIDHALYLFDTVKFHLGQNYQFIDEETFTSNLEDFYYGIASEKAAESRLWFVQFLLVLSFGQDFLSRSKTSKEQPGSKFFTRAMSLLPEPTSPWKDSLIAIEVLSLTGLFLYSIYQRESTQLYISQAIRIAQLEGLHTQLPEETLGIKAVACCNLWWTLYMMDRHFSCSVGVPMNTHDTDITTLLDSPSICSQCDATLGLQVKLSHLLATIVTTVYKSEKTPLGEFLESTRSILRTLAGHAQEIERITRFKLQNSVDAVPKDTRGITLLYHQRNAENIPAPLITLIWTGIKSAMKTLQILSSEDSLLEVFLPFELAYAYGAAIHLTIVSAIYPFASDIDLSTQRQQANSILDDMIHKGSSVAEFVHLESLFEEFTRCVSDKDFQQRETLVSIGANNELSVTDDVTNELELTSMTTLGKTQALNGPFSETPDNTEFLQNIGISSEDFLSVVEQIDSWDELTF